MVDLYLHGKKLDSVFELLGTKENGITYSLGWVVAQSTGFRNAFIRRLFPRTEATDVDTISLQETTQGMGVTDVELLGPKLHVILEAKRGWVLPTSEQLKLYAPRFQKSKCENSMFVTMSEASEEYAKIHLFRQIEGVPVCHLAWKDIVRMSYLKTGTHAEKRLLSQFRTYLERAAKMQNQESNLVYVVSLGPGTPSWSTLSWRDIVNKRGRYFHPVGSGWPKEPPNYLGFRYDGRLQSIRHVDSWKITDNIHSEMPELAPKEPWPPHFLYTLGDPIHPSKTVKQGKVYRANRVWAMLDLLLTCSTISDAVELTKKRQSEGK
jgi:hypothetical protein